MTDTMSREEYERLLAILVARRDEMDRNINNLQSLWLAIGDRSPPVDPVPQTPSRGGLVITRRHREPLPEEGDTSPRAVWAPLLKRAIEAMPDRFSTKDVQDYLFSSGLSAESASNRATISNRLKERTDIIVSVRGRGQSPTIYRKRGLFDEDAPQANAKPTDGKKASQRE